VIPDIGPEFIAALRDKAPVGRNKTVIGGSPMDHPAAKTARSLVALLVSKLRAIKAKKTFHLQPPSIHAAVPSHCPAQHKDTLHLDKIILVLDAGEIVRVHLPPGGEGPHK